MLIGVQRIIAVPNLVHIRTRVMMEIDFSLSLAVARRKIIFELFFEALSATFHFKAIGEIRWFKNGNF